MRFSGWFTGWVPGSVLVVLAAVVATLLPASGAQAAAPRPVISRVAAFDAPLGGRGGILSALVRCTGGEVQPRVRMARTLTTGPGPARLIFA